MTPRLGCLATILVRHVPVRMVALRRRVPDLPPVLRRLRRGRHRRPGRDRRQARLPRAARRGRTVAVADLPVAAGRQRLRHQRLPRHRPGVRLAGGLRPPPPAGPRARHEARDGPRRQPHLRRAPVVRREPLLAREPQARLVLVARRAQQLDLRVLRLGVGPRRADRPVLPAPVQPQAARPQLGEPGGPRGGLRDDALVAGPWGGRLPHGRHQLHLQARGPARRRAGLTLADRARRLHLRPPHPRVPAGDAPRGLRRPRRPADRRRDARRDRRGGAAVHRPRQPRGRHGVPVRAREHRPDAAPSGTGTRWTCATSSTRSGAGRRGSPNAGGTLCTGTTTTSRGSSPAGATTASTASPPPSSSGPSCTCTAGRRTSTRARSSG